MTDYLSSGENVSIYHYSDLEAVKSILETRKMRLTDSRYLNDLKELSDGFSYIKQALENGNWEESSPQQRKTAYDYIMNQVESYLNHGPFEDYIFICSFSSKPDLLSQWRSYGMFAIEFDEEYLKHDHDFVLTSCCYSPNQKQVKAQEAVKTSITNIERLLKEHNGRWVPPTLDVFTQLVELAAIFKDSGFHEENEVRYIQSTDNSDRSIKYRTKNNLLVPYIERDISLCAIKAIHVGPVPDRQFVINSLEQYVYHIIQTYEDDYGYSELEIDIKESSIPFRG